MEPDDIFSTLYPALTDASAFPAETPIGMAYVPVQKIKTVYEPEMAYNRGTLYPELDLPFMGWKGEMSDG